MARDILLTGVFGLDAGRATKDVDLAVAVANWEQFNELKQELLKTGLFREAESTAHRLHYRPQPIGRGYPVDLIPFGDISGTNQMISWPPDMVEIMNVAGYEEALAAAVDESTSRKLQRILGDSGERLITDMSRAFLRDSDGDAEAADLLAQFRAGLRND